MVGDTGEEEMGASNDLSHLLDLFLEVATFNWF